MTLNLAPVCKKVKVKTDENTAEELLTLGQARANMDKHGPLPNNLPAAGVQGATTTTTTKSPPAQIS